jgi:hypothetical protein
MPDLNQNTPLRSFISVHLSENNMKAFIEFMVPGKHIDAGEIMGMLNLEGIKFGVDQAAIERAVIAYRETPNEYIRKNILVAKGQEMIEGKDGYVEYYINELPPVNIDESGKADFRNIEKYKTVEKGKVLAKIYPRIVGKDGINIFGDITKTQEVMDAKLSAGENVTFNPLNGQYTSNVTGIYQKSKNTVSVSETLLVKGNVGLESGNLNYDGVIKIGGNVERGAEVTATGDIFVNGLIESGKIRSSGSLHVQGGINTKHDDCLYIKQNINTTYIEHSNIQCDGDINVVSSIINSNITSSGNIRTIKEGSKIVGGELMALDHIYTDNLGNVNETPTNVQVGIHYAYNKEYKNSIERSSQLENTLKEYVLKINQIKEYIQRMQGRISTEKKISFKNDFDAYKKLESEFSGLKEKIEKLKNLRFNEIDAYISVRDTIFPGVVVHYYSFIEKINQTYKHCTLRFSKSEGKMYVETYREYSEK